MNSSTGLAKYTTTYKYEDPNYKYFLTSKQWYQSDSKMLSENTSYNAQGRVASFTDAKQQMTTYNYSNDTSNNFIVDETKSIDNGKVAKTRTTYGSETACAYPKEVIKYYTDDQGKSTQTKESYTYNMLLGLVSSITDNDNKTTNYTYDYDGRVKLVQSPDYTNSVYGNTYAVKTEYSYTDGYNQNYISDGYTGIYGTTVNAKTTYLNKKTNISSYYDQSNEIYDAYGDLRQEELWNGTIYVKKSQYGYDKLQRVVSLTDADGNMTSQTYDVWGRVDCIDDPLGNSYRSEYNIAKKSTLDYFVSSANSASWRNGYKELYEEDCVETFYDDFGRVISKRVYPNWPDRSGDLSEVYTYDIAGNVTAYYDRNRNSNEDGCTTTYKYDELNRISEVKDAENHITDIEYNVLGNIKSVSMKENAKSTTSVPIYTKSYNELGELVSKLDPTTETKYSYNGLGLNTKSVDRNGVTLSCSYDGLDQLTETNQVSADGTSSMKYQYCYSNPYGCDDVRLYVNGALVTQNLFNYNAKGELIQKNVSGNLLNSNLKMQYDDADLLMNVGVGVQNSNYFYTNYSYTKGRLTQVQTNGTQTVNTTDTANAKYEYYPDGKLKNITYPKLNDGSLITSEYTYDSLGRLSSLYNRKGGQYGTVLSQSTYRYDFNGNITSSYDGKNDRSYKYDKLNRLIQISSETGSILASYTYDLRGNRLTESSTRTVADINTNTSYSYDLENKLNKVTKNGTVTNMSYYADGMRAKKQTGSKYTSYIYNQSGKLVAEANNSSTVTANYVWGSDRVISKKETSGGEYYYLYNGHGDVVQMVDKNGNVVNNYNYDEWGNITTSSEKVSNPFKYAGEVFDQETGLYYLRARYYDPSMGRFINEDSYEGQINNPLSLNIYSYCQNDPINNVDPSGHNLVLVCAEAGTLIEPGGGTIIGACVGGIATVITGVLVVKTVKNVTKAISNNHKSKSASSKAKNKKGKKGADKTNEKGAGGKGWRGDKTWKKEVKEVGEGGTIKDLNGKVPTQEEAEALIKESGGKVNRMEGPHESPNPHDYNHINYTTPSGGKGTIRIK